MNENDHVLAFADEGSGPPLLLIHAFPFDRHLWSAQIAALRDRFRVITPDLRGFGESPTASPVSIDQHADDLVRLLDALGIARAAVCGLSLGGYVALALWRQHHERISALVLADTRATADTPATRERRAQLIDLARSEGVLPVADAQVSAALGRTTRRTHPALVHRVRDMMVAASSVDGIVAALEAMMARPDSTTLLATINVPTLVIVGEEDAITPPGEMRAMQGAIPGADLRVVEQSGHLTCVEQPETFNGLLASFLERVGRTVAD
ncbi:MAG TPA: alpha/beta fold hydrolase [Candidatus Elarobacter sp.]|nr:alpha/beta fold hydrolase [Candidatus Elarobacter sp.]